MIHNKRFGMSLVFLFFVDVAFPTLTFDTINSTILLEDTAASLRINTSSLLGWVDASVKRKIRGFGDYELKSYDANGNNILTYDEVPPAEFVFYGFSLAANTIQHITVDTLIDLGGKSMTFGDYAELFVDTDITLTVKNGTISYGRTLDTMPPIRLASPGSKLAFDNMTVNISDDFNFLQGQLFIHTNVNMVGSHAFVYQSPTTSFITTDATWKFDAGSTFSVAPVTFTDAPYSLKNTYTNCNFIKMTDATSLLSLNACSLMTTYTGLRLTKGSVLFDNAVSCVSDATITITGFNHPPINLNYDATVNSVAWSQDRRFLAVGGTWVTGLGAFFAKAYQFDGSTFTALPDPSYGDVANSVAWSPDGQYLAVGGNWSSGFVRVYRFDGSTFTTLPDLDYRLTANSVAWSPDGRYLAVGGSWSNSRVRVFRFNGNTFTALSNPGYGVGGSGGIVYSVAWSPDGKYLAVGGNWSLGFTKVYRFSESTFTALTSPDFSDEVHAVSWSPDGRYLAVGGFVTGSGSVNVYRFDGSTFTVLPDPGFVGTVFSASWSSDGRHLAVGGDVNFVKVYLFDGSTFAALTSPGYGDIATSVSWSPDGKNLAVGGQWTTMYAGAYPCAFGSQTTPQATSSSIIFGDSTNGSAFDVSVQFANNAVVRPTHGKVVYDCVH